MEDGELRILDLHTWRHDGIGHALSSRRDFSQEVARAINDTLSEILGEHALEVLHGHLEDRYDIRSDEMPCRLPTVIQVLEEMFGALGTKAIGSDVAKKLYSQLGLRFVAHSNYTLEDYMEEAVFDALARDGSKSSFRATIDLESHSNRGSSGDHAE